MKGEKVTWYGKGEKVGTRKERRLPCRGKERMLYARGKERRLPGRGKVGEGNTEWETEIMGKAEERERRERSRLGKGEWRWRKGRGEVKGRCKMGRESKTLVFMKLALEKQKETVIIKAACILCAFCGSLLNGLSYIYSV